METATTNSLIVTIQMCNKGEKGKMEKWGRLIVSCQLLIVA